MSVIIRLQNLPMSANAADIRRFFSGLNIPEGGVHIVGGDQGDAFIAFATDDDARRAMLLDRESINNVMIRLFLSSKNEMQSIIESARNSVMFAQSATVPPKSQHPPQAPANPAAYHAPQDPGYRSHNPYDNGYPQTHQSHPPSQPPGGHHPPKIDPYMSPNQRPPHQSSYQFYDNMPSRVPPASSQPVSSYGNSSMDNYQSHHYPSNGQSSMDMSGPPPSMQKDSYPTDPRIRDIPPVKPGPPSSGDYYQGAQLPRRAYPGDPRDYGSDERRWYNNDRPVDDRQPPPNKRPYEKSYCDMPPVQVKERREEGNDLVVRLAIKPVEVSVMSILDFMKGIDVINKYGVRVELDTDKRPTGYVYLLLMNARSLEAALKMNGRNFKGYNTMVRQSSFKDFCFVNDPSFIKRCPSEFIQNIPRNLLEYESPYTRDAYLELTDLPPDTTEEEVISFIGAPGMSLKDVLLLKYPQSESRSHLRALIKLPSPGDVPILMSARPRPFRTNQSLGPVHLIPISRQQFNYMIQDSSLIISKSIASKRTRFTNDSPPPPSSSNRSDYRSPSIDRGSRYDKNTDKNSSSCIHLTNLARPVHKQEIMDSIRSHHLTIDDIKVLGREALIRCESSVVSKKVYDELKHPSNPFFKTHYKMYILRIPREEFDRILSRPPPPGMGGLPPGVAPLNRSGPRDSPPPPSGCPPPHQMGHRRDVPPSSGPPIVNDWNNGQRYSSHPMAPPPRHYGGGGNGNGDAPYGNNSNNGYRMKNMPWRPSHQQQNNGPNSQKSTETRLHLSSLPTNISTQKLTDILHPFNPIYPSIRVINGRNGPFGLVAFENKSDADAAIRHLNSTPIEGRNIIARLDTYPPKN